MQNIHPNEKLYKCEECSECFALSGTYQVPIRGIKEFMPTRFCTVAKTAQHHIPTYLV
jgi:hypothetical protein